MCTIRQHSRGFRSLREVVTGPLAIITILIALFAARVAVAPSDAQDYWRGRAPTVSPIEKAPAIVVGTVLGEEVDKETHVAAQLFSLDVSSLCYWYGLAL